MRYNVILIVSILILGSGNSHPHDDKLEHGSEIGWNYDFHDFYDVSINCTGSHQSPIDVKENCQSPTQFFSGNVELYMKPPLNESILVQNTGYSLKLSPTSKNVCGFITLGDYVYDLLGAHIHTPSEHTIEGVSYDIEEHAIFSSSDGRLVVHATLFKGVPDAEFTEPVDIFEELVKMEGFPKEEGKSTEIPFMKILEKMGMKLFDFSNMDVYVYSGSLTTPPCSENVTWVVVKNPILVKQSTVDKLSSYIKMSPNNRNIQKSKNRAICKKNENLYLFADVAMIKEKMGAFLGMRG